MNIKLFERILLMEIKNYPGATQQVRTVSTITGEHFSNALIEITDYYEVKFLTSGVTSDTYVEVKFIVEEKTTLQRSRTTI